MPKLYIDISTAGDSKLIEHANPSEIKYVLIHKHRVIGSTYNNIFPGDSEDVLSFCNFDESYTTSTIHAAYETLNAVRNKHNIQPMQYEEFVT